MGNMHLEGRAVTGCHGAAVPPGNPYLKIGATVSELRAKPHEWDLIKLSPSVQNFVSTQSLPIARMLKQLLETASCSSQYFYCPHCTALRCTENISRLYN